MKKRDLEIRLQNLAPFKEPKVELEQYPTHSSIATDILFEAYANGDIAGKDVVDLGCGTGIFAIGASLLGASSVKAYDLDDGALAIAKDNADALGCDIDFIQADISEVEGKFDTALMNPPFGSQRKHADQPFLRTAMRVADVVYSIHMACTLEYLNKETQMFSKEIVGHRIYKYDIPHTFTFHTKTKKSVDIVAINIR
ncbi:MAG: methyltransferase domain-containing protein [Thermoplasmata archaeon]|nr:methyltransferase domain-containing protein [Thermoplasmata archaeon]